MQQKRLEVLRLELVLVPLPLEQEVLAFQVLVFDDELHQLSPELGVLLLDLLAEVFLLLELLEGPPRTGAQPLGVRGPLLEFGHLLDERLALLNFRKQRAQALRERCAKTRRCGRWAAKKDAKKQLHEVETPVRLTQAVRCERAG